MGQKTTLGWILTFSSSSFRNRASSLHVSLAAEDPSSPDEDLNSILKKFWEVESVPTPKSSVLMSNEDQECEHHFQETHSRDSSGRYMVELPFKFAEPTFPGTFAAAKMTLLRAEKRFRSNPNLRECYHAFMREYFDLGHMFEVGNEISILPHELDASYFIPHHGIFQGTSSHPKFRVVFNASMKALNGQSLNDVLFAGPSLQTNIVDIIIKWRSLRYVYSADIQKMYRQVNMKKDHHRFQRILWRFSEEDPISIFNLNTVTYGVSPSAYQALRCLRQLSIDEAKNFPSVANFTAENMYVDDAFFGADTIQEAVSIAEQFCNFLMAGGFPLRKWAANPLSHLPVD